MLDVAMAKIYKCCLKISDPQLDFVPTNQVGRIDYFLVATALHDHAQSHPIRLSI